MWHNLVPPPYHLRTTSVPPPYHLPTTSLPPPYHLPTTAQVLQSMKSAERKALTPLTLREKAAAFARETVAKQRDAFKRCPY